MELTFKKSILPVACLSIAMVTLVVLYVLGLPSLIGILRIPLGIFFILFLPGYALQSAIFVDNKAVDGLERIALSFGLSVAIVPLIAIVLEALPWGIQLWPIVASESLVSLVFAIIARIRSDQLPEDRRFFVTFGSGVKNWWAEQSRLKRLLFICVSVALAAGLVSGAAIVAIPNPGERFTEFYILGADGLAEAYPQELTLGPNANVKLTVGVTNQENIAEDYRIEVQDNNQVISQVDTFHLEPGDNLEKPVTFTPAETGDNVQIMIYLYRGNEQAPYRSLRLWMKVKPAGT